MSLFIINSEIAGSSEYISLVRTNTSMGEKYPMLRIEAAQVAEVYMDRKATVEEDCEYVHRSSDLNPDILVFPVVHIPAAPD